MDQQEIIREMNQAVAKMTLDECRANARLLAQYIQTIEESKPKSKILDEAYIRLAVYKERLADER
jgi:uncharacterized coiled-coil protein SlyX